MRTIRSAGALRGRGNKGPLSLAAAVFLLLLVPLLRDSSASLKGQQPQGPDTALPPQSGPVAPVTPGGAFLRSVLVPGWGHVAAGSYARAGFYLTALSGSLWMLRQTLTRRAEAQEFLALERELAGARLMSDGIVEPVKLATEVDKDDLVLSRNALVEARSEQVEDWTAVSIFLVLLGATDAFVAAHLADYPEPLTLRVLPLTDGRTELRVSVPLDRLTLGLFELH